MTHGHGRHRNVPLTPEQRRHIMARIGRIGRHVQPHFREYAQALFPLQDVEKALRKKRRSYDAAVFKALRTYRIESEEAAILLRQVWKKVMKRKTAVWQMWVSLPHVLFPYELRKLWNAYIVQAEAAIGDYVERH